MTRELTVTPDLSVTPKFGMQQNVPTVSRDIGINERSMRRGAMISPAPKLLRPTQDDSISERRTRPSAGYIGSISASTPQERRPKRRYGFPDM